MIVTLTANPSIDRLARMDRPFERGGVYRLPMFEDVAGGKGINVSRTLHQARTDTVAIYPAAPGGKFSRLLEYSGVPHIAVDTNNEARVNLTIAEPDGTTTKLNSLGFSLTKAHRRAIVQKLQAEAKNATWVVLAGSLPPGVPRDFYVTCIDVIHGANPDAHVAIDTSDGPLEELSKLLRTLAPTLMKPNAYELGQLIGVDGATMETAALAGDYGPAIDAAHSLNDRGVKEVLASLGPAGAVLTTRDGECYAASPPPITPVSTVGAGDCTLAGYVLGRSSGKTRLESLALAVAYGAAATSLPGTTIPNPNQVNVAEAHSWQIS